MKKSKQFKIIALLNAPDFYIERGAYMIKYLTRLFRSLPQFIINGNLYDGYIVPIVVRFEVFKNEEDC